MGKQIIEFSKERDALKRLLSCFDYENRWTTITVFIRGLFVEGKVDDETRDAIKYANKILYDNPITTSRGAYNVPASSLNEQAGNSNE